MSIYKMNSILIISASIRLQLTLNPVKIFGMGLNWYHVGLFIDLHIKNIG